MKAPDFDYLRPTNLKDAISLLTQYDGDAMPLAGGQSLMPMMNFRVAAPEALIDLADVSELRGVTREGTTIRIGAMTRYVDLEVDPLITQHIPLIGLALPHIAHDAIRNRGTIGGSVALADPAAEMPAIMLALTAVFEVAGLNGTRKIAADDFFEGLYETALASDELLVAIHVPVATTTMTFGFHELTQRHGDYALAGVAVVKDGPAHRVAFFGISGGVERCTDLEAALDAGAPLAEALACLSQIDIAADSKASAATRKRLAGVALQRALNGMKP